MTSSLFIQDRPVMPLAFRTLPRQGEKSAEVQDAPTAPVPDLEHLLQSARAEAEHAACLIAHAEAQVHLREERLRIAKWMEAFSREKERYFLEVEGEVVRLSLAIAERILHREASMDPTLLAAAARVALQQVSTGSDAILRVPPSALDVWKDVFRRSTDEVQVQADEDLAEDECILDTRSGSVQLGVRAQLQEIERGFFELRRLQPAAGSIQP